ncbi:DNA-invertase hin [compost metagenome]
MYAALYVRVSTDEQAEHGFSLDAQKERLIAFCKSQGWEDYKIYIDDGFTGTKMDRPALKRMVKHIEAHKIHTVVVYKLDRLSRRQKDVLELLEDVFEKHDVKFKSASEPFDTSTPFGKAMLGVLAVFAQLDRDMIIERTTTGRRQKTSQGNWYGGRIPFGYDYDLVSKMLLINAEESRIVREIFKRYLQGHSRLSIAEWAADRTNARTIDHSTVRDMLCRPIYAGMLLNGGSLTPGKHEAIIDMETWEAAQRETLKRKEGATPLGEYLLTGLLKCGICGGNIVHVRRKVKSDHKDYVYELYACKEQHVRKKDRTNNCSLGYTRRELIEKFVIGQIKSFHIFPNKVSELMARQNEYENENEVTIENLNEQLKKITTNLENLYDAIQSGDIKASAVSDRIKKLEAQRDILENDLDEINYGVNVKANEQEVRAVVDQLSKAWDYFTEDEQKVAIRKLVKSITLNKKGTDPEIEWAFL